MLTVFVLDEGPSTKEIDGFDAERVEAVSEL
jgi:hypothetical protein